MLSKEGDKARVVSI